jgi:hypothetical protein
LIAGWIDFGDRLNQRLPFGSLTLAGAALAAIVAIPLSVVAWLAWTGDFRAGRAAVLTGLMLVGSVGLCGSRRVSRRCGSPGSTRQCADCVVVVTRVR